VALVWAVYVGACLLLTDYLVYASGTWVIVLFVFSVLFGTVFSEGLGFRSSPSPPARTIERETLRIWQNRSSRFSLLFAIVGLVGCVQLLIVSFDKFSLDFSLLDILSLGNHWSVVRYEGELEPWSIRLLIMWVYPAVLLAGISFALALNRARKWLAVAPLVPAALIATIFATRAGLLISLICWFSGFFAVRYRQTGGTYALFQRKLVLLSLMLIIGGLVFFVVIDAVRGFKAGDDFEAGADVPRLSKYFFGSVPAFANWVHASGEQEVTMGSYTFAGVFDLLGIKQRQIGVYEEHQTLAGGEDTNIYTLLRGLIQDFTLPGASLFGVLLGFVAGKAARSGSANHLRDVLVLAGYYAFIIYSPIVSLFTYNGLILAWCMAALVLGFRTRPRHREARIVPSSV
jgi:oligosaccharide repeat unit polymerase